MKRRDLFKTALGSAAAMRAAPLIAQECRVGPPQHNRGPNVFMEYDQLELDAAYDQSYYEPLGGQTYARLSSNSQLARARLGAPRRVSYGETEIERLDIFSTNQPKAPIFIFVHGGNWSGQSASNFSYAADVFINAGAHYVVPDFVSVRDVDGDLRVMADQVRRAIAWVYRNAQSFDGDAERIYVGGHSSGGHLCGVALTTDWKNLGLPTMIIKGGLAISGMYELEPVRRSWRCSYVAFTDVTVEELSPQRHIDKLVAPITVAYGSFETPEFQRQSRDFAAAVNAAGKPARLIEASNYTHSAMVESLGNPYAVAGRAALELMGLVSA